MPFWRLSVNAEWTSSTITSTEAMANELRTGVLLNYCSAGLRLLTGLFLTPFIITSLGTNEYGLFLLSNSVNTWLALSDLGLGSTVTRFVTCYQAEEKYEQEAHFLGQSIMLFSLIAFITLQAGLICYLYLGNIFPGLGENNLSTLKVLFLLTLSNLVIAIPLRPLSCVPAAYKKFIIPGVFGLVISLLNAGLTAGLLLLGFKAIGLTVLSVCLGAANLLWGLYYTLNVLKVRVTFRWPDMKLYREMIGFSVWVFLNQLMDMFYWQAGAPILARSCGTTAVAVFTLGISFSTYFMTASTAISSVLSPGLMQMVSKQATPEELTQAMIRAGRMQLSLLCIILSGFAFLGQDFLKLWVGNSMGEQVYSIWLGALLVLVPLVVPLTQNTGIAILQGMKLHHGRAIILLISSAICVVLGYFMSLYLGPLGMFAGTAISLICGQIILINIYYRRKAGLDTALFFLSTYRPMLSPMLILAAAGALLNFLIPLNTWGPFLTTALGYAIFSSFVIYVLYLTPAERKKILHPRGL